MRRLLLLALVPACADPSTASTTQAATVCAAGPIVDGIDVSYYQGNIDWNAVKAGGIDFAFIRVSDGSTYFDSKFDANWAGAHDAGVIRGAYQFFRPSEDAIAQADLLLSHMGALEPGDLPPVLDVEATDGVGPDGVAAGVQAWVEHVAAATGRLPLIYTGKYFWQDSVGSDLSAYPLWIANWGPACPNLPDQWSDWAFWQTADDGSVSGIGGAVDLDVFNGDLAALGSFGAPSVCGDGVCSAGETTDSCAADCPPCGTIDPSGGIIDDGDACFTPGGPVDYLRSVADGGYDGDLVWTHTTEDATEANYAEWTLFLAEAGTYRVEVYTAAAYAQSTQASYRVRHDGAEDDVVIDQTAVDGWQSLGDLAFAAGGGQSIHVGDNTGELLANNVQIVFDAVRLTRLDAPGTTPGDGDGDDVGDASGGCNAGGGGSSAGLLLIGLALMRARRSRQIAARR